VKARGADYRRDCHRLPRSERHGAVGRVEGDAPPTLPRTVIPFAGRERLLERVTAVVAGGIPAPPPTTSRVQQIDYYQRD
jgi:hypothetical protein